MSTKSSQLRKYEKIYEQCVRSAIKKCNSKPKKSSKSKRHTSNVKSRPKKSSKSKRSTSRKLSRYNIFIKSYFKTHKNKTLLDAAKAWNKVK